MDAAVATAWCAGLYEGEGTVTYGETHRGPFRLKVTSTDRDVLDLLAERSGRGHISGPHDPNGFGVKPYYEWTCNGHAAVALAREWMPLLGKRRRARLLDRIAVWETRPRRKITITPTVRARVHAMRADGATYQQIADVVGVSFGRIAQVCKGTTPADAAANAQLGH